MARLTLEEIAKRAKAHKQTPHERRAQRVSLIMGVRSKNSTLSREKVESLLDELEGHAERPSTGTE
jgi:hypothetical protein